MAEKAGNGENEPTENQMETNALYYGDNLDILRKYIPDNSVDLIYLDPPFNSSATYNVLFKEPSGISSQAQMSAFEDTWHWSMEAEMALQEIAASAIAPNAYQRLDVGLTQFRRPENGHASLPDHDVHPADRTQAGAQGYRLALSALRSDRQPLSEGDAGRDIWASEF